MAENLGLGNPSDWYKNDLGRTGDTGGLDYWNSQMAGGMTAEDAYANFKKAANTEIANRPKAPTAAPVYTAAPVAQSTSQGYSATPTDLNAQYLGMGVSNPAAANTQLLSGQVNNQYLDAQAQNIQTRLNRNLNENLMPNIGSAATGAGQYGSSRQGIAQGKAVADTQDNYAGAMANLYGGANEAAQNRMSTAAGNLSGIGATVGMSNANAVNTASQFGANAANASSMYNAGQTNSTNLANQGQMQNFYLGNRQLDQSGLQLGANLYGMGNTGNTGAATQQTNLGNDYLNAPLTATQNYANTVNPYTGLNGSQSTAQKNGGGAMGALGGAIAGSQIYNNLGFGGGNNGGMTMSNGGGVSNLPSMYLTS